METSFDVIVIGAGPAGGKCAFELAKRGMKVLLAEKFKTFEENDFSSAGMLVETLSDFSLPKDLVGAYWSNFVMQTSTKTYTWEGKAPQGIVLSFAKLKQYFADECRRHGERY